MTTMHGFAILFISTALTAAILTLVTVSRMRRGARIRIERGRPHRTA